MNPTPIRAKRPAFVLGAASALLGCGTLTGCAGTHVVNVLGSYFPFWLLCMVLGVAAAFVAHALFLKFKIEPHVGPLPVIYLCVIVAVSCLAWLLVS